jgi:hypothetical protein
MKFSVKPVAVAVALGLASAAAQAQLAAPSLPNTPPPANGVFLSIFDTTTLHSELVNLGYLFTDISAGAPGNPFTPNSQTGAFAQTSDPSGGGGQVLQLDWGVIPGFSSTFGTPTATTEYDVVAAGNVNSAMLITAASSLGAASYFNQSAVTQGTTNMNGIIGNWTSALPSNGQAIDTTGTSTYNANGANEGSGSWEVTGATTATTVGAALGFYNITKSGRTSVTTQQFANSTGNGFWFLSSNGDLTWNLPIASAVPLPAAVWLLISGLAGLGAIQRRRLTAAA